MVALLRAMSAARLGQPPARRLGDPSSSPRRLSSLSSFVPLLRIGVTGFIAVLKVRSLDRSSTALAGRAVR